MNEEELIEMLKARLRNVSSLTLDQAAQVAKFLIESGTVTYATMMAEVEK